MKLLTIVTMFCVSFSCTALAEAANKKVCVDSRNTLTNALVTNAKQTLPLFAYGLIAAFSGANLHTELNPASGAKNAVQKPLLTVPLTTATFHWFWTAALFGYSTVGKLLEAEPTKYAGVISEALINLSFTGAIRGISYRYGAEAGIIAAGAFVAASILRAGNNSPVEYVKPSAASCIEVKQ